MTEKTTDDSLQMVTELVVLQAKLTWTLCNAVGFIAELVIDGKPSPADKAGRKKRRDRIRNLNAAMGTAGNLTTDLGNMLTKFQAHGQKLRKQAGTPS